MSDSKQEAVMPMADSQSQLNRQVRQLSHPLSRATTWMKLIAVFSIVGVIWPLIGAWWTLFYLWVPVWTAVLLFQAATYIRKAALSGSEEQLSRAFDKLGLYFKILGIIALIGLITLVWSIFFPLPHWLSG
jgi:Family of unknown function (DUF5362)